MKSTSVLLVLTMAFLTGQAQMNINVQDTARQFNKGLINSYTVLVPKAVRKTTDATWVKYIAEGSKSKAVVENGETVIRGVVVKNISGSPLIIYSKLLETIEGVRISAAFTLNDSVFISKEINAEQDIASAKFMRDFVIRELRTEAAGQLATGREKQKALEKALDDLIKQEEKSNKVINENQRAIQRAYDNIAITNKDVTHKDEQIAEQKTMVEKTVSDANANKGAKKTLKELENAKKKFLKQNENQNKNIDKLNKEIRGAQRVIEGLRQSQDKQKAAIAVQAGVVNQAEVKLNAIQ